MPCHGGAPWQCTPLRAVSIPAALSATTSGCVTHHWGTTTFFGVLLPIEQRAWPEVSELRRVGVHQFVGQRAFSEFRRVSTGRSRRERVRDGCSASQAAPELPAGLPAVSVSEVPAIVGEALWILSLRSARHALSNHMVGGQAC